MLHDSYLAVALQTRCDAVNRLGVPDARAALLAAARRVGELAGTAKRYLGPELRLAVLPEYVLSGFPMGESAAEWQALACITTDGPEATLLAQAAQQHALYLCVNAYVLDAKFPALFFQATLVFDPAGALVLNAPRVVSMFAASPYDVLDAYLDHHGAGALFPVADTAIGRLGAIASEEILYPEIARGSVMRGAEVLLHPTGEYASAVPTAKEIARLARAVENMASVVSANASALHGTAIPAQTTDGMSKIVDHRGLVLAAAAGGETMAAHAEIDLAALRRARLRPGLANLLSRQPYALYARAYAAADAQRPNGLLLNEGRVQPPQRSAMQARQADVIERLHRLGLL